MKKYVIDVVTGEKVAREDAIRIETVTGKISKGGAYIAKDSADIAGYHGADERKSSKQAENIEKIRWGVEFECKFKAILAAVIVASLLKKGSAWSRAEKDGSLTETETIKAAEFHLTGNNFRRVDKDLATVTKLAFLDDECGTHFNLSFPDWTREDYERIADNANWIFSDLLEYLLDNPEETEKRCGRYFPYYADNTGNYTEHRNWLNLAHCYEWDEDKIRFEWRLAKFTSVRQYVNLMQAITAVFKAVNKWFLQGYPKRSKATISANVLKAWKSAWARLEKIDEKYGRD